MICSRATELTAWKAHAGNGNQWLGLFLIGIARVIFLTWCSQCVEWCD